MGLERLRRTSIRQYTVGAGPTKSLTQKPISATIGRFGTYNGCSALVVGTSRQLPIAGTRTTNNALVIS